MMPNIRIRLIKIFKLIILLSLAVVVVVIAVNFFSRSKSQPRVPQISDEISSQKIEQKDKVKYFEDKKGRLYRLIEAERHYVGPDGLNHLEGNVIIVFLSAADGKDVHFSGEEIIYDMEGKHFTLKGNTEIKFKDTVIISSYLEYFSEEDSIKSNKGIHITSKRFFGTAAEVDYRFGGEKLTLQKDVKLSLLPDTDPSVPIHVRADKMVYRHIDGTGILEGNVSLTYKESRAEADHLRFELEFNKDHIKSLFMQGNVNALLVSEKEVVPQTEQNSTSVLNIKREIKADEMFIRNFQHSMAARDIQTKGNCHLLMVSTEGSSREIQAGSMELYFTRQGKLKTFSADGSVRMTEKRESAGGERYVQGESMQIEEGRKGALDVVGGDIYPATIVSQGYKIDAEKISVLLNSNNLEAAGGVKVTITPLSEGHPKVGFFKDDASVYISAGEMRYSGEAKRFLFKEKVKVWQGKDMLLTKELALLRDTGRILCSGGVSSFIAFTPKEKNTDYQVGIKAEVMSFSPEESMIAYQENSSLKVKDITLRADTLVVFMDKETGKMQKITAQSDVSIKKGQYEGLGQEANYDIQKEEIVLTGSPILIDNIRGRTEGDKLTFHIPDGRIIIENKGQERSVSVIKS